MELQEKLDILYINAVPVYENVVIKLTKENNEKIDQENQKACKILNICSQLSFDEVLIITSNLKLEFYPNLFIFVIEIKNFRAKKLKILLNSLLKLIKARPMVLQLSSEGENVTKFYYKEEYCSKFRKIKEISREINDFHNFESFLWLYLK